MQMFLARTVIAAVIIGVVSEIAHQPRSQGTTHLRFAEIGTGSAVRQLSLERKAASGLSLLVGQGNGQA